jgi:phage terminase large subunit GpA-like protein
VSLESAPLGSLLLQIVGSGPDSWPEIPRRAKRSNLRQLAVSPNYRAEPKEELFRWLRLERPTEESGAPFPPGYCHFPKYGEEYFKELTAEQLVTRVVNGYRRPEWQKTRDRNEALDARCYVRAAAAVFGMDRCNDVAWSRLEEMLANLPRPGVVARPVGQPQRLVSRSNFMDSGTRNW